MLTAISLTVIGDEGDDDGARDADGRGSGAVEHLQSLIGQADCILRGKLDPHLRCCVNVAAGVLRTSVADMRKVCVAAASEPNAVRYT